MEAYDAAVESALERNEDPQEYLNWKTGKPMDLMNINAEIDNFKTFRDAQGWPHFPQRVSVFAQDGKYYPRIHCGGCGKTFDSFVHRAPINAPYPAYVAGMMEFEQHVAERMALGPKDPFQILLQKCFDAMQKGAVALLLLFVLAGVSRADSLTEAQISAQLEQGVIPLAAGVGDTLALNLLDAQALNIIYTANEPTSLQLSIDAVLKAISIYVWPGGPTLITSEADEPIVFEQSRMAVDTGASVLLTPSSIDFGPTPITTPEPSTLWMLLPLALIGLRFAFARRK